MKKGLLTISVLILAAMVSGATGSQALYGKLQAAYKGLKSFQATVQQSNHYQQLSKTITYSGNIYFTPGRMLMSFSKPSLQRLMIKDGQVELYDAASKTLFRTPMQAEFGKMNPVEILQIYWSKSSVSVVSETKTTASVKLVPSKDAMVSSLSATMNKNSGMVSKLSYTDKSGNSVTYTFSNIKLNGAIPGSVWSFQYPKGIQVVEQ
jgi:outer membrane lipoprotein-sorting protein